MKYENKTLKIIIENSEHFDIEVSKYNFIELSVESERKYFLHKGSKVVAISSTSIKIGRGSMVEAFNDAQVINRRY